MVAMNGSNESARRRDEQRRKASEEERGTVIEHASASVFNQSVRATLRFWPCFQTLSKQRSSHTQMQHLTYFSKTQVLPGVPYRINLILCQFLHVSVTQIDHRSAAGRADETGW